LIGPRWTDGPGRRPPVHSLRQQLASALASCSRQHSQSQPATWCLHSSPAGRPGKFANRPPHFWKLQVYPSTI
jgi:hypothetical protein